MRTSTTGLLFIAISALISHDAVAQHQKEVRKTSVQQVADPNVSGQPNFITAPDLEKAKPAPEPEIKMNVKKRRRVRIVPAPPPGPPANPIPPKQ